MGGHKSPPPPPTSVRVSYGAWVSPSYVHRLNWLSSLTLVLAHFVFSHHPGINFQQAIPTQEP